jgi:FkbH-like protein
MLPIAPPVVGGNEHRLAGSPHHLTTRLNARICELATSEGVDILPLHSRVAQDGLDAWYNPVLWHRAKQEIAPPAAPVFGDHVARILAAQQGRSRKCLVLDLDNTLWGGVIGDDGLDGIILGQGSALGEAFLGFQAYVKDLSRRGVMLAVCSKNDERNALEPFESHPDMILKRSDIAAFVANWRDKAANVKDIAAQLNIGVDALAFVDDNGFERDIVRRELPMVAVPEMPEDPALWDRGLSDAGYFDVVRVTPDDLARTAQYQGNIQRESLKASATDMESYLKSLNMTLHWGDITDVTFPRVVQLINKTNQFNLTTHRYNDEDLRSALNTPRAIGLQMRLVDQFGDNGIIAVVLGLPALNSAEDLLIESWLMSCRVLGRRVEEASLNLLAAEAAARGYRRLIGLYRPTAKNGMVSEHYQKLGFAPAAGSEDGAKTFVLPLRDFQPIDTPMTSKRI